MALTAKAVWQQRKAELATLKRAALALVCVALAAAVVLVW
jgi:hypothetical protein